MEPPTAESLTMIFQYVKFCFPHGPLSAPESGGPLHAAGSATLKPRLYIAQQLSQSVVCAVVTPAKKTSARRRSEVTIIIVLGSTARGAIPRCVSSRLVVRGGVRERWSAGVLRLPEAVTASPGGRLVVRGGVREWDGGGVITYVLPNRVLHCEGGSKC
eukprot:CAMPEP_0197582944 /NCGR_PEP_ID=MMETSP1326-20131121/6014_1 /TAXON_ID=1155430 /ORGANISM="Genus nov. species nov., Strain RCC2288" /LENGTH=158 /DNA_ID=CAMNT_0043147097 /DNA_START=503 /DNA_END=979 /DNA_ORIENTATION=+